MKEPTNYVEGVLLGFRRAPELINFFRFFTTDLQYRFVNEPTKCIKRGLLERINFCVFPMIYICCRLNVQYITVQYMKGPTSGTDRLFIVCGISFWSQIYCTNS